MAPLVSLMLTATHNAGTAELSPQRAHLGLCRQPLKVLGHPVHAEPVVDLRVRVDKRTITALLRRMLQALLLPRGRHARAN